MDLKKLKITELESLYNLARAMHEKADRVANDTRNFNNIAIQKDLQAAAKRVRLIENEIMARMNEVYNG